MGRADGLRSGRQKKLGLACIMCVYNVRAVYNVYNVRVGVHIVRAPLFLQQIWLFFKHRKPQPYAGESWCLSVSAHVLSPSTGPFYWRLQPILHVFLLLLECVQKARTCR